MRARRQYRPLFDRLDGRLLLDASGVSAGVSVGSVAISTLNSSDDSMPGDEVDPSSSVGYYGTGTPPDSTYDPSEPPVS